MRTDDITVSYVVTVYNKEPYIGATVASLLQQDGGIASEYIFVDDVSNDRSVDIIGEATRGVPHAAIIRNSTNAGPSVRVNQGARLARGKYLQFIDSDDILAANASTLMLSLIEQHSADVVHGEWEKTGKKSAALLGTKVATDSTYKVSDNPLELVFEERLRRMAQMVRRDVFLAAGGCDERIFVQDESLSLRLAHAAKRIVLLNAPILLIPQVEGELSRNISQCNHDRFLAARNMLLDFPDLNETVRRRLYRRCVSAAWKQHRLAQGALAVCTPAFVRYALSKCMLIPADERELQKMSTFFAGIKGVRRMESNRG